MKSNKSTKGFTLIELLIVIAIIGILAAVLIPNLLAARNRANESATQAWVRECVTAVEVNRDSVTQALPTETDCSVLTGKPTPSGTDAASDLVIYDAANGTYTVSATTKATDTVFTYDGSTITKGS